MALRDSRYTKAGARPDLIRRRQMAEPTGTDRTLWTVARIAEHIGVSRHRVEYVIDTRGIRPIDRAGIARVFDTEHVAVVASVIARMDAERKGVGHD